MTRCTKPVRRLLDGPGGHYVVELAPGGVIRVREPLKRTWYETTAGALFMLAARTAAEATRRQRTSQVARRMVSRGLLTRGVK